jgi:glycosyltransferase involved in cell wall biosynthesis
MNGKISVIVPCYNQGEFLDEALDSIFQQTYTNWECIVVNDGSTDKTNFIAEKWSTKDARFRLLDLSKNYGLSAARNKGIESGTGDFILPLDADDKISIDYLEKAIGIFNQHLTVKVVYGKAEYFGLMNGTWLLPKFNYKELLLSNSIFCSSVFRKSAWLAAGGYDETMKSGMEDWDLWIRILSNNNEVFFIGETVFYYRKRSNSMLLSLYEDLRKINEIKLYVYKKNIDIYNDNYGSPFDLIARIKTLETEKRLWQNSFRYNFLKGITGYFRKK